MIVWRARQPRDGTTAAATAAVPPSEWPSVGPAPWIPSSLHGDTNTDEMFIYTTILYLTQAYAYACACACAWHAHAMHTPRTCTCTCTCTCHAWHVHVHVACCMLHVHVHVHVCMCMCMYACACMHVACMHVHVHMPRTGHAQAISMPCVAPHIGARLGYTAPTMPHAYTAPVRGIYTRHLHARPSPPLPHTARRRRRRWRDGYRRRCRPERPSRRGAARAAGSRPAARLLIRIDR
jgi:hypothetical protein